MTTLLVNCGGARELPTWQHHFAALAPQLQVHALDDPAVPNEAAEYALVWHPPAGRLAALPNLRLILSGGAGVDHIVRDPACPPIGIVRMGGTETAQRMGEYVCLAALSLLRDMPRIIAQQAAREWRSFDPDGTAADMRVGIMGLGSLGVVAARMLMALGFPVSGWSRTRKEVPGVRCFAGPRERDAFLAQTDLLVCLLPDTADTRGAIRAETLAMLPRGSGVINAGRGPQLVLPDLLAAIDSGHLSGAVLDVFETEPLPSDHPVWTHPRVIVTPHTASLASHRARTRFVVDAIAAFERGERPPNLYDHQRGY